MSKKTSDKETITGLFREEAAEWLEKTADGVGEPLQPFGKQLERPVLPTAKPAPEKEQRAYWRTLRAFFRSGKGGGLPTGKDGFQPYPALLSPFWKRTYTQRDYPCWVNDSSMGDALFYTLPDFLKDQIEKLAPEEGQARVLKDNLLRLEGIIREKLRYADEAFKARPALEEALEELEAQLSIRGEEGKAFSDDIVRLRRQLPREGVLIPFSPHAPLHLLAVIIQRQLKQARKAVREDIAGLINKLNDILAVEQEKSPESHSPEHLHSALDFADSFLNFEELSSVLPSGGSETMPEERHQRIEKILETLKEAGKLLFLRDAYIVCSEERPPAREIDWTHSFPAFAVQKAAAGHLSTTLSDTFDEVMDKAARVFAAIRIGNLEVNNGYTPEMHADFFAHFDWRSFNERELAVCPPVLLVADAQLILEKELDGFSRLLASNRPVKLFVEKSGRTAAASSGSSVFRQELGALAIAHRNTFVLQSAIVKPRYLHQGFTRGLGAAAPALFHLLSPLAGEEMSSTPDLWSSAAVEGREFPGFIFDSQKGPKWGSRFDIQNNPGPEADWPEHQLPVRQDGEKEDTLALPFTFADFAAQDRHFVHDFHLVPPRFWTSDLIPIADYLELSGEEVLTKVPYIWLIDKDNQLQRAAVAWPLVLICQERLDFWHYLQENAGVHSYHVEQATERVRQQLEAAAEEKITAMQAAFEKELEAAKEESARSAMEKLAAVLLDLDTTAILADNPAPVDIPKIPEAPAEPAEEKTEKAEAEPPPAPEEEEEMISLGEAWIETPLCTSCNECIDANSHIFQYNAEKQAFVADPKGGPFADIVKAAEKCPVRIIHPGAPQNPDEPGLEEWVKRAEPFQA
jgi:ferredoxin